MTLVHHRLITSSVFLLSFGLLPLSAQAINYGIYDSRGLAMGGAAVASATWHQAQYYNPALLALHSESEDDSQDGRFVLPNFVVQADNVSEDIADAVSDDLDTRLGQSVDAFNVQLSPETAGQVAADARELQSLLDDLANQDVSGEAFLGFSVSEPSMLEGGAFYFGVRAIGAGSSHIPEEDQVLLDSYITALEVVATGGDITEIPAELIDSNGNLIDPTEQFNSTADLSGIVITEWAVAMAKQFDVFGQSLALGITPKVMRVDVFRETTDFDADELDFIGSQRTYVNLNADMGVVLEMFDHYRVAFAVKDLLPKKFKTEDELTLQLKAKPRLGLAYVNDRFTLGLDVDVIENKPIAAEAATQEASLGAAVSIFNSTELRLGYRQDITGLRDDVIAGGIAYQFKRAVFELSYSRSADTTGAAMQFGWAF